MLRDENNLLWVQGSDSLLWKFIAKQRNFIEDGAKWNIRNGRTVKFFLDKWLVNEQPLKLVCLRPLSLEEENSNVADWATNGC